MSDRQITVVVFAFGFLVLSAGLAYGALMLDSSMAWFASVGLALCSFSIFWMSEGFK